MERSGVGGWRRQICQRSIYTDLLISKVILEEPGELFIAKNQENGA